MDQQKQINIQTIVNFIGNEITNKKLPKDIIVSKGVGEVEINNVMYQIQVILNPDASNWIKENGIVTNEKKQSWIKRKLSNLFTSTMDTETQKQTL